MIEFRAYDKIEKKLCKVSTINFDKGCFLIGNSPTPFEVCYDRTMVEGDSRGHFVYFKDLELMQYIGLKDCDGVKIFENDILEIDGGNYLVISDGGCSYELSGVTTSDSLHNCDSINDLYLSIKKIVGNKYDGKIY